MAEITISKTDRPAIVDDEMEEIVLQYQWSRRKHPRGDEYSYAFAKINGKWEGMHRFILGLPNNAIVDHVNGDPLDNRIENLRACNHSENMRNRRSHNGSSSKYKGVYFDNKDKKWRSQIRFNGKKTCLGSFDLEKDAAKAYNDAAKTSHGDFARLNEL